MNLRLCLTALLLVACGKVAPQPESKSKTAVANPKPVPVKELPPVPQGKLPKMDPEKAKFIAVPSTPKDPEVKKVEMAAPTAAPTKPVEQAVPKIKKAEVPAAKQ